MERSYVIKPLLNEAYPMISHGKGIYLYDTDGKAYIDASSGAVTASIGHGISEVIEAMNEQANQVSFVYRSQFTSKAVEDLAFELNKLIDADEDYHTFFVNSGSEATETAMKIAIQHFQEKGQHQKNKVISRWTSYHGITLGALSLSGHKKRRERFVPLLHDYPVAPPPSCYRCPFNESFPGCQLKCADELNVVIEKMGAEHIAAFIAEPIIGAAGGAIVPPRGYYERIKEICEKHEILLIADEVMTGLGRTGEALGMDHWKVKPDILALGKGLSAGYTPLAATMCSESVLEPIKNGSNFIMSGHTFSANPQSAATALAVLYYLKKHGLVQKSKTNGAYLKRQLKTLFNQFDFIGDVRGLGMMVGIEFVRNRASKDPFPSPTFLTNKLVKKAQENGLLIYPASTARPQGDGDAVIIAPPLISTKEEVDQIVELLKKTLKEIQAELN
ncbi:aspartate aminotransferase family protein [Alkalihalophilus lindianensis]|uniref:Aspartate aminotransferase family protein n=1 Tax=Alkalihalophilus lindianensis TaxID=1630542 RepID=A0ABU3X6Y3_9BACI|nr:aspartate aminotransferase family protein [Alkalihalophilus lindianensis]MDV2683662.1 aspartate aminotransferase family protein [Alkalihalophilus lindianensis]